MISITNYKKIQLSVMVLLSSFVVAGCSGSSSSSASADGADTGGTPGASSQGVQNQTDPDSSGVDTSLPGDDSGASQDATIPVTFNITVPKYSSNALQVRLQWADTDVNANWVTDESWSVSADLPANTERQLVVTFNDDNGAVTLGRFETALRIDNNGEQLVSVAANQFDTSQWDNDGDGVSNLDEVLQGTNPLGNDPALAVQLSYELIPAKTIRLSWSESAAADYYRVLVNPDGVSGFEQVGGDISAPAQSFDHRAALFEMVNASYIVQACNGAGCVDSNPLMVSGTLAKAVGYFKASNAEFDDRFGSDVSISQDGLTLAVAAVAEESLATGINADDDVGQRNDAGAAYVFAYVDNTWVQQAYIKPSHVRSSHEFGSAIGLSGDGNTLVVGAWHESLGGKGVNPEPEGRVYESGAAFVFVRKNGSWEQEAYIKASNPDRIDYYGGSVAISGDGNTFAVGAHFGSGIASGVNGDQSIESTKTYGAVYVYERSGGSWRQYAYVKASNPDNGDFFGRTLSMSADGKTLAVGAMAEESSATGINGDQSDNSLSDYYDFGSGAVYLFRRTDESWYQQAYIKSSNGEEGDRFGSAVALSAQGNVLVVGAYDEDSAAVGVDGDQSDNSAKDAGAAYVFDFSNDSWSQTAYLKASNAEELDTFGYDVSISDDGQTVVVGAKHEDSAARGINDRQNSETDYSAGAAYVFSKQSGTWQQKAYVKASNTDQFGYFGSRVSLSGDGQTLAVGSYGEQSAATSINGDQRDNSFRDVGAVYLY